MRRSRLTLAVSGLLALVFNACATQLPPISKQGGAFRPLHDERELWKASRAEEEKLLENVGLYDDPELTAYLDGVVARLEPPGMAANREIRYRVRVIDNPMLNAFSYPHGSIYVHTGLLARMESEDELATVLAHEMTHVENRHMLRQQRHEVNKGIGISVAAVTAAVVLAVLEDNALDDGDWFKADLLDGLGHLMIDIGLQMAFTASVTGYGRGLELEADEGGFAKMDAAGYDLAEAPKVYQVLLGGPEDPQRAETFFFGSHPRLAEREASSKKYLAGHPVLASNRRQPRPAESAGGFARHIGPVLREDARLNLDLRRLDTAAAELERLRSLMPADSQALCLQGRLQLARADAEEDAAARRQLRRDAEDAFLKSIELDPDLPRPHRELGLLLFGREQYADACIQLRRYAQLDPDLDDLVEDSLAEMEKAGNCR